MIQYRLYYRERRCWVNGTEEEGDINRLHLPCQHISFRMNTLFLRFLSRHHRRVSTEVSNYPNHRPDFDDETYPSRGMKVRILHPQNPLVEQHEIQVFGLRSQTI